MLLRDQIAIRLNKLLELMRNQHTDLNIVSIARILDYDVYKLE